jgi:hypothetical protein
MATKDKGRGQEKAKPAPAARHEDGLEAWCAVYIVGAVVLSAGLNALANGLHAERAYQPFAWIMGVAIPFAVLVLGKIGSKFHKRGMGAAAWVLG